MIGTGSPNGLRTVCWDLPCEPAIVGQARRVVRDTCNGWAVPAELADDLVLVVSELVGNAVVYGRPPVRLSLWSTEEDLCVRVTDHGPEDPRRLELSLEAIHGRGLTIVETLADRWGVVHTSDDGKTVWAAWRWPSRPPDVARSVGLTTMIPRPRGEGDPPGLTWSGSCSLQRPPDEGNEYEAPPAMSQVSRR
ncbi:ATP-binding protein [Sphaerisporangium sp. NPDC051011]|uniref:ATP-binding protein n=1 Tax=Sphaerisporangium sp. NPDC051011 TaxID=3155792 RepID=UPI0033F50EA4